MLKSKLVALRLFNTCISPRDTGICWDSSQDIHLSCLPLWKGTSRFSPHFRRRASKINNGVNLTNYVEGMLWKGCHNCRLVGLATTICYIGGAASASLEPWTAVVRQATSPCALNAQQQQHTETLYQFHCHWNYAQSQTGRLNVLYNIDLMVYTSLPI